MELEKQDRNGVRTAIDLQRRYNPRQISKNKEDIEKLKEDEEIDDKLSLSSTKAVQNKVITENINRLDNEKQPKEKGKGLSENNFTNEDKKSIHTHSNKKVLDSITEGNVNAWNDMIKFETYRVGDIYTTTNEDEPNSIFHYGIWEKVNTQELENVTIYMWLRKS